eukprot:SAG31_NODE_1513_length_8045_cov_5.748804_2_plen_213_part_00
MAQRRVGAIYADNTISSLPTRIILKTHSCHLSAPEADSDAPGSAATTGAVVDAAAGGCEGGSACPGWQVLICSARSEVAESCAAPPAIEAARPTAKRTAQKESLQLRLSWTLRMMRPSTTSCEPIRGDTFSISAAYLSIKVPYFSDSCTKNEKVTPHRALAPRRRRLWSQAPLGLLKSRHRRKSMAQPRVPPDLGSEMPSSFETRGERLLSL